MNKSYNELNAELNLYGPNGEIQFDKDKEAARAYFLDHVNQNTVFFHSLSEKLNYLFDEGYYDKSVFDKYDFEFIKALNQTVYAVKFRFPTFMGAFKYYTQYTLKTFDGKRYLERYEDRVVATALTLANGDKGMALTYAEEMISGRFQPATPTFLNAGKAQRGEFVSCFLLDIQDNLESIIRSWSSAAQLSKRGGGVALNLTNLRAENDPIKKIANVSSSVVPQMKVLEDIFSYINQLGARQGAGAVYLNVHHPDIMKFLDTKKENADEKSRIKTLSLGVVIPDITFQLAKTNEDMYLFSPYDVERVYGKPFSQINVTEEYYNMVDNPEIKKTKTLARTVFRNIAKIQFESGYPYVMFEDTVNKANPIDGKVTMSNLCSEILQVQTPSVLNEDLSYEVVGNDISCNLGSLNIAKVMDNGMLLGRTVEAATRALTAVADMTSIDSVPTVKKANAEGHAIGLGQMNLHGFLAREGIHYDSEEAVDFTSAYFALINYWSLDASNKIAREKGKAFVGFEKSAYADGSYFEQYKGSNFAPKTEKVKALFEKFEIHVPGRLEWFDLSQRVKEFGLYNMYRLAVPPTGSISYINNSTSSIHPIAAKVEIRKEGKLGRLYYPAAFMTNENLEYYKDAYEIGYKAIINVYAAATKHTDQGLSCTLFFKDTDTTQTINAAQGYAHHKGLKTIYYVRIRQNALEGTDSTECVSCQL